VAKKVGFLFALFPSDDRRGGGGGRAVLRVQCTRAMEKRETQFHQGGGTSWPVYRKEQNRTFADLVGVPHRGKRLFWFW
jgi:hypothetical protein